MPAVSVGIYDTPDPNRGMPSRRPRATLVVAWLVALAVVIVMLFLVAGLLATPT